MNAHREDTDPYDAVVIGGGAAGLSAALVLGRSRRRTLVVDSGRPRNAPAAHMQGVLSRDGMSPAAYLAAGRAEVAAYGVGLRDGEVTGAEPDGNGGFVLALADGGTLRARRLVVTTGLVDELPAIEGLAGRWGRDVLHCPYCHGWEVRDQAFGVIAHAESPAHQTLMVANWSKDVVLFTHTAREPTGHEEALLDAAGVRIERGEVTGLAVTDDRLTGVRLADGRTVDRSVVFAAATRLAPRDAVLRQLGAELRTTPFGAFVAVDETGRTSVPGVWAAGNVTGPQEQVVNAVSRGYRAGVAINNELLLGALEEAVAGRPVG
ncbi:MULTISPECIES: NAD(P)/FAD-dependent oxidoreductase [unclassified Streptomyces]|uniref:NAD(P)/FAD-dependent oxidoreductase n=1 Tax=unclassified Streptomyces TaxID=2593676 RepID=UPI0016609F23|nr:MULTISPECIES: NAD(P)/FAD-dependent oxidoreductase [unclassified Streptomyces]MBD0709015.1 thioredoxin reductase [Streptomyces sp. CBMA291]MBD0715413.1 thioredoxin reductase [Streptomyces sp. CBMA370]